MIRGEALYGRKPCDLKRCGVKNAELSWHNGCQMSAATRVHSFQSDAVERVCLHGGISHDKHLKPFTLRQERDSALADFLHRQFSSENTPFICPACFNEVSASRGEGDDPHAQVFGALDPADQAFRNKTVHGNADRTRSEIDDRAYHIDR